MQDMTLDDGRRYREFFAQKEDETPDQFQERMQKKAQKKLRNPEVNKFYQVKIGRNEPCPCGSGLKFKRCCLGKVNQPEFQVA